MLNFQYCERCGEHENEIDETIYTCKCVKGKTYDLDRALSEIEEFFNENDASKVRRSWVDYSNGKDSLD